MDEKQGSFGNRRYACHNDPTPREQEGRQASQIHLPVRTSGVALLRPLEAHMDKPQMASAEEVGNPSAPALWTTAVDHPDLVPVETEAPLKTSCSFSCIRSIYSMDSR